MLTIRKGRPSDMTGRSQTEIAVYDLLDGLGIEYEQTDHEPVDTMEACSEIDAVFGAEICKNLFLCNRQKTGYYLLMMPGGKSFKAKDLAHQIGGARLSFADESAMMEYLKIRPGAVSVMGLMNDKNHRVRLLIDRPVAESETFVCHPCVSTSSLKMKTKDMLDIFLPAVSHEPTIVDLLKQP